TMATVRLKDLFQQAFNITPRYLIPNYPELEALPPEYSGIEVWPEQEYAELSELGTPILEKITLDAGSYFDFIIEKKVPKKVEITYEEYVFPGWPMIDVSQNKVVVKTNINGRNG